MPQRLKPMALGVKSPNDFRLELLRPAESVNFLAINATKS